MIKRDVLLRIKLVLLVRLLSREESVNLIKIGNELLHLWRLKWLGVKLRLR